MTSPPEVGALVVMVDWSAAAKPKPPRPSPDACWLAHGIFGQPRRPPPVYFRTRQDCVAHLRQQLVDHDGPALVGFDFSLGYPQAPDGSELIPGGRAGALALAEVIEDTPTSNNRFAVASDLNRALAARLKDEHGPFWGCPAAAVTPDLPPTKPPTSAPEWRRVESSLRAAGHRPHPVWKLFTTGSVGSQTLLGLAAIGRLLADAEVGPRLQLWPFDAGFRRPRGQKTVVIAEVWPSLMPLAPVGNGVPDIKDARQVAALRNAAIAASDPWAALERPQRLSQTDAQQARAEGWILGLPRPIGPSAEARS
ncbi:MAG: hypothetical protein AAF449_09570 [Myxococcota bacterium]